MGFKTNIQRAECDSRTESDTNRRVKSRACESIFLRLTVEALSDPIFNLRQRCA